MKVFEAFGPDRQRLSISEASEISGLDRATTRRCLLTLADLEYATYDGKYFALAPKVLRLGHAWLSAARLPAVIQPHLDELSRRVGQSASASTLDGAEIVYIARASERRVMSISLMPGSRLPAYCSSMGRVLLASRQDSEIRALLESSPRRRITPSTVVELDALVSEIHEVKKQGYAVIDQELEIGLCSIAVPISDRRNRVVAAINVGASAGVCPAPELTARFLDELLKAQATVQSFLL
jgi:IclR family pca regulon transcriptional regulator